MRRGKKKLLDLSMFWEKDKYCMATKTLFHFSSFFGKKKKKNHSFMNDCYNRKLLEERNTITHPKFIIHIHTSTNVLITNIGIKKPYSLTMKKFIVQQLYSLSHHLSNIFQKSGMVLFLYCGQ